MLRPQEKIAVVGLCERSIKVGVTSEFGRTVLMLFPKNKRSSSSWVRREMKNGYEISQNQWASLLVHCRGETDNSMPEKTKSHLFWQKMYHFSEIFILVSCTSLPSARLRHATIRKAKATLLKRGSERRIAHRCFSLGTGSGFSVHVHTPLLKGLVLRGF